MSLEFTTAAELRRHYADVRMRLGWIEPPSVPRPIVPRLPEPEPTPAPVPASAPKQHRSLELQSPDLPPLCLLGPKARTHAIIRIVCAHFNLPVEQLLGPRRLGYIMIPRLLIYYLLREHVTLSFLSLQKILNRDHSTILTGAKTMTRRVGTDPQVREMVNYFRGLIDGDQRNYWSG